MKQVVCSNPICLEGHFGWFIDEKYNQIYQVDFISHEVRYIGNYAAKRYRKNSYSLLLKCENELYIFPIYCKLFNNIVVYNLEQKETIEINVEQLGTFPKTCINSIWNAGKKVVVHCVGEQRFIEIDKLNKNVMYYTLDYPVRYFQRITAKSRENYLYGIALNKNQIVNFNYKNAQIEKYDIVVMCDEAKMISFDGNYYWLSNDLGIYIYDYKDRKIVEYFDWPDSVKMSDKENIFMECIMSDNYVWYIPTYSSNFVYVDKMSKKIGILSINEEYENSAKEVKFNYLINCVYQNRYLYLYSRSRKCNFRIDMETVSYQAVSYELNEADCDIVRKYQGLLYGEFILENGMVNYRNLLSPRFDEENEKELSPSLIGKKIYKQML